MRQKECFEVKRTTQPEQQQGLNTVLNHFALRRAKKTACGWRAATLFICVFISLIFTSPYGEQKKWHDPGAKIRPYHLYLLSYSGLMCSAGPVRSLRDSLSSIISLSSIKIAPLAPGNRHSHLRPTLAKAIFFIYSLNISPYFICCLTAARPNFRTQVQAFFA